MNGLSHCSSGKYAEHLVVTTSVMRGFAAFLCFSIISNKKSVGWLVDVGFECHFSTPSVFKDHQL